MQKKYFISDQSKVSKKGNKRSQTTLLTKQILSDKVPTNLFHPLPHQLHSCQKTQPA